MLLQGFSADADSIPWSQVVASGNNENHNNLVSSRYTKFSYVWLLSFLLFICFFFFCIYCLYIEQNLLIVIQPIRKRPIDLQEFHQICLQDLKKISVTKFKRVFRTL